MAPRQSETDPSERLARSVDLLVRLKIEEVRGERTQREMIRLLGNLGAKASEIASLLGVNRTTVDPELSKARAGKARPNKGKPRIQRRRG